MLPLTQAPRLLFRAWRRVARGALGRLCMFLTMALPIGLPLASASAQEITAATYASPTRAYPHGVLGDAVEWAQVHITTRIDGARQTTTLTAGPDLVFEDTAPRLWDVTGDGKPEVVLVQSHQAKGARLVIIGLNVQGLPQEFASTPHIGTRFRWLAPVGAADFDGDGHIEVAYVDRPHLAKTLRVWRYAPDSFAQIATLRGVTNHRIGEDYISGGVRTCGQGPEMIVADANWRNIMAIRLGTANIDAQPIARFKGRDSFAAALACDD